MSDYSYDRRSRSNSRSAPPRDRSRPRRLANGVDSKIGGDNLSSRDHRGQSNASREYRAYDPDQILEDLEGQLHTRSDGRGIVQHGREPPGDLLDYIFEGVEKFVCRHEEEHPEAQGVYVVGEQVTTPTERESRLQKIPPPNRDQRQIQEHRRDVLDYMFECGGRDDLEEKLVIGPTLEKDRDILDHVFECGSTDPVREPRDSRDFHMRTSMHPLHNHLEIARGRPRSNSLIEELPSNAAAADRRIGRVEILRMKKRQLEARKHMVGEPNSRALEEMEGNKGDYGVPADIKARVTKIQVEARASQFALLQIQEEEERNLRARLTLVAGATMFLLGTGLIVTAVVIFFPKL